ncbi:MAG: response regulator [bacterium]|nr:response regulator [bacterium]
MQKKDPTKTEEAPEEKKTAPKKSGKRILIVEDERPLAHALELKFQHDGFDTVTCTNGLDALAEAKSGKFACILLDLIMPQMDGFTFLEEMKSKKIKGHVVILSNLGQDEDRERAKELGAVEYFVKSNTPITEIIKKVKSII